MYRGRHWIWIGVAGTVSATVFALAFGGNPGGLFLSNFTQLPLFLVGLSYGAASALLAGALTLILLVVMGMSIGAPVFLALYLFPSVVLARQALLSRSDAQGGTEWYPTGLLVMWVTGLAMLIMTLTFLVLASQPDGVQGTIARAVDEAFRDVLAQNQEEQRRRIVEAVVPLLPGISATLWILLTAVNGALAQGLLLRGQRNRRPSLDICAIELPRWLTLALGGAIVAGYALPDGLSYYASNAALVLGVPYFFAGLSVVHGVARRTTAGGSLLLLFYFLLCLFSTVSRWPAVAIAALGLIDQWTGTRKHTSASQPD